MLGYICGVSHYPQICDQDIYRYKVLPRPYRGSFEGFSGNNFVKEKGILDLVDQSKTIFWESIKKR